MNCPRCGKVLESYSDLEGGWCPYCEEWYPYDIIIEGEKDEL